MKLHELKASKGANTPVTRKGRGAGSGNGKTAGFGHKGQKARSGVKKAGFEGGQMPLQRRLPKFGFKNFNRVEYKAINVSDLQALAEKSGVSEITPEVLNQYGMTSKNDLVKILANGTLSAKLSVKAHKFSQKAKEVIEAAGGSVEAVSKSKKAENIEK